ncbi:MAG: S1/P1 nuclease [Flavobacteriales bacterium]|jgi:hypothetical protein|nr:S1/P1 nuclease [Flavobacteriales bacterium]
MRAPRLLLAGTALLLCAAAQAWSAAGHRVVARIAEAHLDPKARAAVQAILGEESMADVAPWMDVARRQPRYRFTNTWHWVTIPDGSTYGEIDHKPEGDVVEATGRMAAILAGDTASFATREFALRCLVHLVGDLHQPLHVGNGLDKGGNDLQVRWNKRGTNLHHVWDQELIKAKQPDEALLVRELVDVPKRMRRQWQRGTPADWAHECMALRPAIYTMRPGDTLEQEYADAQWPVVAAQLQKAGLRLAWLLNTALG